MDVQNLKRVQLLVKLDIKENTYRFLILIYSDNIVHKRYQF